MPLILQSIMDGCSLYEILNGSTPKIYTLLISLNMAKRLWPLSADKYFWVRNKKSEFLEIFEFMKCWSYAMVMLSYANFKLC